MFNKICIGILGGGQLARMSAFSAFRMGFEVAILEKESDAPASQITHNRFVGWVEDDDLVRNFCSSADVITLENEFVDFHRLEFIESLGKRVVPHSRTIGLIQDKFLQKRSLQAAGIPVASFMEVSPMTTFAEIQSSLGLPFVLKSRKMGYDGYGNALVENEEDFKDGMRRLTERHIELMAEEFVDFRTELATSIVRTPIEIRSYPVVETVQKNHICHTVIAPAEIPREIMKIATETGIASVKAVNGFGIFGIEFFLTKDERVLVNEMAPRPHNSAHYTIEACVTSQFENHIRSVLGFPLGSTEMVKPYAVMVNLLGKTNTPGTLKDYHDVLGEDDVHLHLYGKQFSRFGRKMGHITLVGDERGNLLRRALAIEQHIVI